MIFREKYWPSRQFFGQEEPGRSDHILAKKCCTYLSIEARVFRQI